MATTNLLTEFLKTAKYQGFKPKPYHSLEGDFVTYFTEDADPVGRRVDDVLTVYEADGRLVGVKLKQIGRILSELGDHGHKSGDGCLHFGMLFVMGYFLHAEPSSRSIYDHFAGLTKGMPLTEVLRLSSDDACEQHPTAQ